MKRVRVLLRSGRFLVPATVLLSEGGTLSIVPRASVSEASRTRGSLSPREVGTLISNRVDVLLEECGFSARRARRRMELLDREERELLEHLGVDLGGLAKRGEDFYEDLYLVRIKLRGSGQDLALITDRRSAMLLESYIAKYCSEVEEPS